MRFVSFEANGEASFGLVEGDGVVDLGPRLKDVRGTIDLLTPEAQKKAAAAAKGAAADYRLDEIAYLRAVPFPEKIICIGVNYGNRAQEYDQVAKTTYPSVFLRVPESMTGHNRPMIRPQESEQLDYEGEIGLIIGQGGRRIPRDKALSHIAALTCVNEGAVRDWMRHGQFNVTQGKNFDATGAYGPWIVTADEFPGGYGDMHITTKVNGEVRQNDTTANIIFDFAYIISYLSTFMTLKTGDVIASGTPTGSGARLKPPVWLKAGDEVTVEVSGVGLLRNPIEAD